MFKNLIIIIACFLLTSCSNPAENLVIKENQFPKQGFEITIDLNDLDLNINENLININSLYENK